MKKSLPLLKEIFVGDRLGGREPLSISPSSSKEWETQWLTRLSWYVKLKSILKVAEFFLLITLCKYNTKNSSLIIPHRNMLKALRIFVHSNHYKVLQKDVSKLGEWATSRQTKLCVRWCPLEQKKVKCMLVRSELAEMERENLGAVVDSLMQVLIWCGREKGKFHTGAY